MHLFAMIGEAQGKAIGQTSRNADIFRCGAAGDLRQPRFMASELRLIIAKGNRKLWVLRHAFHGKAQNILEAFGAIFFRRHEGLADLNPRS